MFNLEYLKSILHYDPETGLFIWLVNRHKFILKNKIAGMLDHKGYVRITICGKKYRAHRLAWFYMTGKWPEDEIDHFDTNKANNKWNNLREANDYKNRCNVPAFANNKLGIKGVHLFKGRYRVQIQVNKKKIFLGSFETIELAINAYKEAALKYQNEFAHSSTK